MAQVRELVREGVLEKHSICSAASASREAKPRKANPP
jgi:hypothetical protein